MEQKIYTNFDDYVEDWPEGEPYRTLLERFNVQAIIPGNGPHGGLPGGYLWVRVRGDGPYLVLVRDGDDGRVGKLVFYWSEAVKEMVALQALAPLDMWKLASDFGYQWEM